MKLPNVLMLAALAVVLSPAIPGAMLAQNMATEDDSSPVESQDIDPRETTDEGSEASSDKTAAQPDSADTRNREPQRWALLVGVNDYATIRDLHYCGRDIQHLRDRLTAAGFPAENVVLMRDGAAESRMQPFRATVVRQLETILDAVGPNDLVLFAFSGHGIHIDGASYLCPIEAQLTKPKQTMISLTGIYRRLAACRARQKLMLIDACRNDPRPGGTKSISKPTRSIDDFSRSLNQTPEGILLLTSCRPGQVSIEDESLRHGVFMHYLLKGLEGDADRNKGGNFDGRISFLELFNYASLNTKTHVMRTRSLLQEPLLRGEIAGDGQLAVALPSRPRKLPSRFCRYRRSGNMFAGGIVNGPDMITANNPHARSALMKAFELLRLGSNSSEGVSKNDCRRAVAACAEAMRLEPGNPFAYFFRGIAYRILGEYDHALTDFRKIEMPLRLEMDFVPDPIELRHGERSGGTADSNDVLVVAEVQGERLRVESVIPFDRENEEDTAPKQGWIHQRYVKRELQFLTHDPESVLRYILDKDGSLVKLTADNPKALEALRRARDIIHGNVESEHEALRRDMTAEECDRAIAACAEALRIEPENAYAIILRGLAKRKRRDFEGALADFQKYDLPLCVQCNSRDGVQLMIGDKATAKIYNGRDLRVTRIKGDWLWVEAGRYKEEDRGWLLKRHVK